MGRELIPHTEYQRRALPPCVPCCTVMCDSGRWIVERISTDDLRSVFAARLLPTASMPIPLTEHGRSVLTELHRLPHLVLTICGHNNAFNERLKEEHEQRKITFREDMLRRIGHLLRPGQDPEKMFRYTGENPAEQNQPYTDALEKFVSEVTGLIFSSHRES